MGLGWIYNRNEKPLLFSTPQNNDSLVFAGDVLRSNEKYTYIYGHNQRRKSGTGQSHADTRNTSLQGNGATGGEGWWRLSTFFDHAAYGGFTLPSQSCLGNGRTPFISPQLRSLLLCSSINYIARIMRVVAEPNKQAIEKLHAYNRRLTSFMVPVSPVDVIQCITRKEPTEPEAFKWHFIPLS